MSKGKCIGSDLDALLAADALLGDVSAIALKRVIVWQVLRAMEEGKVSKVALAGRMGTSRSQLDRFLDGDSPGMTLDLLSKAADALGLGVRVTFVRNAAPSPARQGKKGAVGRSAKRPAPPARKRSAAA